VLHAVVALNHPTGQVWHNQGVADEIELDCGQVTLHATQEALAEL
jgi:hypothetical protein